MPKLETSSKNYYGENVPDYCLKWFESQKDKTP